MKKFLSNILQDDFPNIIDHFIGVLLQCETYRREGREFWLVLSSRHAQLLTRIFCDYLLKESHKNFEDLCNDYKEISSFFDEQSKFRDRINDILRNRTITDSAFEVFSRRIAKNFLYTGQFPEIVIYQEVLAHGRNLNGILRNVEQTMLAVEEDQFNKGKNLEQYGKLKRLLPHRIHIEVYRQNESQILLYERYRENMRVFSVCPPSAWRKTLYNVSKLISRYSVNAMSCSWNFVSDKGQADGWENKFRVSLNNSGYEYMISRNKASNIVSENYVKLYPNNQEPKAILTLRKKSGCSCATAVPGKALNNKITVTPMLLLDHLSPENVLKLHLEIKNRAYGQNLLNLFALITAYDSERIKNHIFGDQHEYDRVQNKGNELSGQAVLRRISQLQQLVLTSMLWKRYTGNHPFENHHWDILALMWELRSYGLKFKDFKSALKEIWLLEDCFDELMTILLAGSPTIPSDLLRFGDGTKAIPWGSDKYEIKDVVKQAVWGIENAISEIGFEAEENADWYSKNRAFLGEGTLSRWGDHHSLTSLLGECENQLEQTMYNSSYYVSLPQVVSVMMDEIDRGVLNVRTILAVQPRSSEAYFNQSGTEFYTELRPGEMTLFLWPERYENFVDVLLRIQFSEWKMGNPERDIHRFVLELKKKPNQYEAMIRNPDFEKELYRYYLKMTNSGQKFSDWEFLANQKEKKRYERMSSSEMVSTPEIMQSTLVYNMLTKAEMKPEQDVYWTITAIDNIGLRMSYMLAYLKSRGY